MRAPTRSVVLLALAAALAACADGAPAEGTPVVAPEGFGALALTVQSTTPLPGGLVASLVITATSTGAVAYEADLPVGPSTVLLASVFLKQGTYDLALDLASADGQPLYAGAKGGVKVLPGLLSEVTLAVQPAGGVQILVDLAGGGDAFQEVSETPSATQYLELSATQRVVEDPAAPGTWATQYVAVARDLNLSYRLITASTVATLATTSKTTLLGSGSTFSGGDTGSAGCRPRVAAAGGEVLVACLGSSRVQIFALDGLDGAGPVAPRHVGTLDLTRRKSGSVYDTVEDCSFLADDQLNLFCLVTRDVLGKGVGGMVHAASPNGRDWTPLVPYAELEGGAYEPDFVLPLTEYEASVYRRLHVLRHGAVYRAYLLYSHTTGPFTTSNASEWRLQLATSLDRAAWTTTSPASPTIPFALAKGDTVPIRGLAAFRTGAGWELLWVDKDGYRHHATDPD